MKELRIRQERIKRKWTLEHVAQHVGTTNQAISLIEKNQNKPSYDVLVKLENLFNLPHQELFKEVNQSTTCWNK